MTEAATQADPDRHKRVFVVHGRNTDARDSMFDFLRAVGLSPIEWSQAVAMTGEASPYIGQVLDAAFDAAQAVVVLMTPDEVAYLRSDYASGESDPQRQPAAQARPNVLFEAGMAMGRDAGRTVLVELGDVRPFSDVAGRHAVRLTDTTTSRKNLADRLETAGCAVDRSGDDWLTKGDFTPPPPPGSGLPLGRRLPKTTGKPRVRLDVRYHDRSKSGRLEIINLGSESVFDLNMELPEEAGSLWVHTDELPLEELPGGKSVKFVASRSMGPGKEHFKVRLTGRTADGEAVDEKVFVSLVD